MGRISPRNPIPQDTIDILSAYPIRWVHRQMLKRNLLPATYTEFLFRKVWRMKRGTPAEVIALNAMARQMESDPTGGESPPCQSPA